VAYVVDKPLYYAHNTDSVTFKYGKIGAPGGYPIQGRYGVETSGSSTTVTAIAGTPFGPVKVGDIITFKEPPDTKTIRKVATRTDNTEITVDTAIDLSGGAAFHFEPFNLGATDDDGWVSVREFKECTVHIRVDAYGGNPIVFSLECRGSGLATGPEVLEELTASAAGDYQIEVSKVCTALRLGIRNDTTAAGTDSVTAWISGRMDQQL